MELPNIIDTYKSSIINVSETHLDGPVYSNEILDNGYTVFRRDRDMYGGGVLSAFSNDLIVSQEHDLFGNYERIWSKLEIAIKKPLYIGSVYRTTNSDVNPLNELDHACIVSFNSKVFP